MKTNVVALVPVQDFTQAATQAATLVAVPLEAANEQTALDPIECAAAHHPQVQHQQQHPYSAEHIRQMTSQTCCML